MSTSTSTRPVTAAEHDATFPPDFVWGSATAAYQIEGSTDVDGRAPSIWDTFCRVPGAVVDGDTGDVACDHYRRYPQDVALMAELGLRAYRFSTAWPRICPEPGRVARAGLDHYSRLVDALLEREITPWLTLYHWDLPQALEDRGGWTARETADRFAEYALAVHGALGDRVRRWTTLNEPWCSAFLGYVGGQHAPGRRSATAGAAAIHHLLLAHGRALEALREADPAALVGITLNPTVLDPADPADPVDVAAQRRADAVVNTVFLDPLLRRAYPPDLLRELDRLGASIPVVAGDLELIGAPLDFLGVNYYQGGAMTGHAPSDPAAGPAGPWPTTDPVAHVARAWGVPRPLPRTAMDWEVQPEGLTRLLRRLHDDYTAAAGLPMYVTENGAAYADHVEEDGSVLDEDRAAYVEAHLRAVADARAGGVDVRGYFVWSLLDNFEWAYGYDKRFGIVRVDYATQRRTPKLSAYRFAAAARAGRVPARGTVRL